MGQASAAKRGRDDADGADPLPKRPRARPTPTAAPMSRSARRRLQRQVRAAASAVASARAAAAARSAGATPVVQASWTATVEGTPGRILGRAQIFHGRPVLARRFFDTGNSRPAPRVIFGLPHQRTPGKTRRVLLSTLPHLDYQNGVVAVMLAT